MDRGKTQWKAIFVTAVVTAVLVAGGLIVWQKGTRDVEWKMAKEGDGVLNEQLLALEDQLAELKLQVEALEHENETLRALVPEVSGWDDNLQNGKGATRHKEELAPKTFARTEEVSQKPRSGWEVFFPGATTTTLMDEHIGKVERILGPPPFLVRSTAVKPQFSREIWIFLPYDEDPTGLYVYFKGGRVHKSRLDEFNGLPGSAIFSDHEFWYN